MDGITFCTPNCTLVLYVKRTQNCTDHKSLSKWLPVSDLKLIYVLSILVAWKNVLKYYSSKIPEGWNHLTLLLFTQMGNDVERAAVWFFHYTLWHYDMESLSKLGNLLTKDQEMQSFGVFFVVSFTKLINKQSVNAMTLVWHHSKSFRASNAYMHHQPWQSLVNRKSDIFI